MRTAEYQDKCAAFAMLVANNELLREENRFLTDSLEQSRGAVAAVMEQREELARRLRESKR